MNRNSRTKNSIINLIAGFGGYFFTTLLQFAVRTVFIHTLGSSYLGINGLFSNILSMLALAELGIGSAIVYRLYKPLATHDEQRIRTLIKFYKLAYKAIGVVVFLLGLLIIPFLPKLIKDYERLGALGINAVFLFLLYLTQSATSYLFLAYRSTILIADQRRYIVDIITYAASTLKSIIQIITLFLIHDFVVYTSIAILCSIINSLIVGVVAKKCYPNYFVHEKASLSKQEILDMFKDCGALFVYKVNGVVVKASDNLVLSSFIGIVSVGLYSNYLLLHNILIKLIDKIFAAFKSSMGNYFATESIEKQYSFFKTMLLLTTLLYGTAGIGVAVCANEMIETWLGTDYVLQQPISILVGIEVYFAGIKTSLAMTRNVSGVFRQAWFRPLIGCIINIVVSIALVGQWGIAGVLTGTIASYLLAYFLIEPSLIYKYTFKKIKPLIEYYRINMLYIVICIAVTVLDMWICSHFFVGHAWFSVIIHIIITSLSVPGILILLFWNTRECQYLVQLMKRIYKKAMNKLGKRNNMA